MIRFCLGLLIGGGAATLWDATWLLMVAAFFIFYLAVGYIVKDIFISALPPKDRDRWPKGGRWLLAYIWPYTLYKMLSVLYRAAKQNEQDAKTVQKYKKRRSAKQRHVN